jgi:hypothetical protein
LSSESDVLVLVSMTPEVAMREYRLLLLGLLSSTRGRRPTGPLTPRLGMAAQNFEGLVFPPPVP